MPDDEVTASFVPSWDILTVVSNPFSRAENVDLSLYMDFFSTSSVGSGSGAADTRAFLVFGEFAASCMGVLDASSRVDSESDQGEKSIEIARYAQYFYFVYLCFYSFALLSLSL